MKLKHIERASDKQKKKFSEYLADGEELVAVFGIGRRYYWTTVASYFILIIFLIVYPLLLEGLKIIDLGSWHPVVFLPALIVALVGFPYIFKLVHLKHRISYLLTDRRVLIKDGLFSVKLTSAPYDKITHLTVKENFFAKLSYQIGDITIHTAGPTPIETDLVKVQHPVKIKNLLEELIIKERSLLGVVTNKNEEPLIHSL